MNFKEIYTRVQNYINDDSAATLTIIKETINLKAKEIMRRGLWTWSLRDVTFTTTSGTQDYYLSNDLDKVLDITQRETPVQLRRAYIGDFDRTKPDPTKALGNPRFYMHVADNRVKAQPTEEHKVIALSTDNQDITGLTGSTAFTINGIAGGVNRIENVSLSATNVISSTNSYTKLFSITTDIAAVGTIRFTQEVIGTEFLELYPNETERTYNKIKLHPVPNGSYTMYVRYQALQPKLKNDSDVLIAPSRFADCVSEMTIGDMLLKQGDQKATSHIALGEKILNEMKQNEDLMFDYVPSIRPVDGGSYVDTGYPFSNY